MKQTIKYYFSLEEVMKLYAVDVPNPWMAKNDNRGFYDTIKEICGLSFSTSDNEYTRTLFQVYIWPKYYREFIFVGDSETWNPEFGWDTCGAIFTWLEATKENYGFLIKTYNEQRSNLLSQLKTITRSTISDTPQEIGEWEDDEYISSRSGTTTSTDAGTLINRIDEIRRKIKNVYEEWANEFREFIIW